MKNDTRTYTMLNDGIQIRTHTQSLYVVLARASKLQLHGYLDMRVCMYVLRQKVPSDSIDDRVLCVCVRARVYW